MKINTFTGIDCRPCALDTSYHKAQNITTNNYPLPSFGITKCTVPTSAHAFGAIWRSTYSGFTTTPAYDAIVRDGTTTTLSLTYADSTTPLTTLTTTIPLDAPLINANRLYYDLQNKYVYYAIKQNNTPRLEVVTLTDPHSFATDILLDNTTAGVVIITIWDERTKPYFEPNDNITLACDNWSNNSAREDASCFGTVEPTATSSKGQAVTYVVSEATSTRQSNGSYKHVYKCTVTGGGGKVFESTFNTVYFGGRYAPITFGKRFPNLADICFHRNRYAGVSADGTMLILSAQGDFKTFYDYSGEETDSYYMEFATVGPFTAIKSFSDTLVCFKRDVMHIVYGSNPSDYQLAKTINGYGCIDRDSVCECNGYLYFLSNDGICAYMGGTVMRLPNVFDVDILSAKMVAWGNRLVCLLHFGNDSGGCYVYDTEHAIWTELYFDGYTITDAFVANGVLYITDGTTLDYVSRGDGAGVLESNICHNGEWNRKTVLRVRIRAIIESGTLTFSLKRDNATYQMLYTTGATGYTEADFMVRNIACKSYKYKITTTGKATILEIVVTDEV